jgi:chromosome segregation ATPase
MMDTKPTVLVDSIPPSTSMVERMDSAIGETSSLVGAVLSEVVRRALRGGIGQLGERLNEHASGAVVTAIAEQLPALERTVVQTAGASARAAALDAVEDRVAKAESQTVEARRQLADRIAESERAAESRAEEARQALAQRIAAAERASLSHTEEARELLTERIERSQAQALTARRELAQQIERTEEHVASTAQELRTEIETTSRRAGQEVTAALTKQMDELCERSRKGTAMLKTRVKTLEDLAAGLNAKLQSEEKARQQAEARYQELASLAEELRAANEALHGRLGRLEQPGFLRRLWNRLFSRKPAAN